MILDATYAGWLLFFVSTAVSIGLFMLSKRVTDNWNPTPGFFSRVFRLVALCSGFTIGFIIWRFYTYSFVVITTTGLVCYESIGSNEYTALDGNIYLIEPGEYKYLMINATNENYVEDYVMYGMTMDFGFVTLLPAHGTDYVPSPPEYMPWETPPDKVMSSIGFDSKLWIRRPEPNDQYTHE